MCQAYITNTRLCSHSAVHGFCQIKKETHEALSCLMSSVNVCVPSLPGAADKLSCLQRDGAASSKTFFQDSGLVVNEENLLRLMKY